jgi:hypothetical protein
MQSVVYAMRLPIARITINTVSILNESFAVAFFVLDFENELYVCGADQGFRTMDNFVSNKTRLLLTGIRIPH